MRDSKRFPKVSEKEMSGIVYMVRSGIQFFVHGDFDRTIVESYKAKEGLERVLKDQDKKSLANVIDKKRLDELDEWRAKITHSGIQTKAKAKLKNETDVGTYDNSVKSLSLLQEILEKV